MAILAQAENGEMKIAEGALSSATAHETNPVTTKPLVTLTCHTAEPAGTLNQALVHENERSGAAWALEWFTLPPLAASGCKSRRSTQVVLLVSASEGFSTLPGAGHNAHGRLQWLTA